jgi:phenylalanyl-tRNA synthetase beta chain
MIVTLNWLRDWINFDLNAEELANRLTTVGLEVGSVSRIDPVSKKIVVGLIRSVGVHPKSSRFMVCEVDVGRPRTARIVSSDENIRTDMCVAVALPGSRLPGGELVRVEDIEGVRSSGLFCTADKLEINDGSEGILELDPDARTGSELNHHLGLDDSLIDIELTPNRGDCLSVRGVAREIAAITGTKMHGPGLDRVRSRVKASVPLTIDAPEDAPRYVGRVIEGIRPGSRTPDWMRERLRRCGIRGIDPIVDITNYVMLELGQPLHAFDREKISGGIVVRHSRRNETLELLDGKDIALIPGTLLIADTKKPIGMAGIMGGLSSGVGKQTRSVMLEAAFFRPGVIAAKAREYGLQTDASFRFERTVDPNLQKTAIERATRLLLDINGGKPGPVFEALDRQAIPKVVSISLRRERLSRVLGQDIPVDSVSQILRSLDMSVKSRASGWTVTPPSYRVDIRAEHDLVEEVARINGYDAVPIRRPANVVNWASRGEVAIDPDRITDYLVDCDYQEVMTYSFVDAEIQQLIDPGEKPIPLMNPIASHMSVMRTSLLPGLLQTLASNYRRQWRRIRMFETGNVFHGDQKKQSQVCRLAGAMTGDVATQQWDTSGRNVDFYDIKGHVEGLFRICGHTLEDWLEACPHAALHPAQSARVFRGKKTIGWIGRLHPEVQKHFSIEQPVYTFELDLDAVSTWVLPSFTDISRFPAVNRDLSLVVDQAVPANVVRREICSSAGPIATDVSLFDVYEGEGVEKGKKSLSYGLTLQASSRNLNDQVVEEIIGRILNHLKNKLGCELRSQ